jgi:hypothetical protein
LIVERGDVARAIDHLDGIRRLAARPGDFLVIGMCR